MFHRKLLGETTSAGSVLSVGEFDRGFLLGVLVGEGHFGGDGRQPHVTLKLHVRHEALLRHLMTVVGGGRLYGPYHHGDRHYFQLMFRGATLRDRLVPLLDGLSWRDLDPHSFGRYSAMKERYRTFLESRSMPALSVIDPEAILKPP